MAKTNPTPVPTPEALKRADEKQKEALARLNQVASSSVDAALDVARAARRKSDPNFKAVDARELTQRFKAYKAS